VARGLGKTVWNSGSLHTQIKWFQDLKPKICGSSSPEECRSLFRRSLFIVGEFGGNDYNSPLFAFRPLAEAHDFVPHVVDSIGEGVEKLIAEGAVELVVPGVLPIGCFPIYLTLYGTSNSGDYDGLGCLKKFNDLSTNHNSQLKAQLASLQAKYPSARIMYADFYSGVYDMVRSPGSYGELPYPFLSPRSLLAAAMAAVPVELSW